MINTQNLQPCPCCSSKPLADCCAPFINGIVTPSTPEQLMRSRYTAYTQTNIEYIVKTMKGLALKDFDSNSARQWAQQVQWKKLKILKKRMGLSKGLVEFLAYYSLNNQGYRMHEVSEFHFENNQWYYIGGKSKSHL